jgi:hypothetical protein
MFVAITLLYQCVDLLLKKFKTLSVIFTLYLINKGPNDFFIYREILLKIFNSSFQRLKVLIDEFLIEWFFIWGMSCQDRILMIRKEKELLILLLIFTELHIILSKYYNKLIFYLIHSFFLYNPTVYHTLLNPF